MFLGSVSRSDLARRFGVSESAASRDFALYLQLRPTICITTAQGRCASVCLTGGATLFHYSASQVLTTRVEGFGGGFVATSRFRLPCELPSLLNFQCHCFTH